MLPGGDHPDGGLQLQVKLESHLPVRLATGDVTAIFCFGYCFHQDTRVTELELSVDGKGHRPTATRMPRRDLFDWLHTAQLRELGDGATDPEGRSYRSGFWATLPVQAGLSAGAIELGAEVHLADGRRYTSPLGRITVVEPPAPKLLGAESSRDGAAPSDTIAVCIATFDPDPGLLRTQLDSLREQTDTRWIAFISDGGSAPERFEQLLELVGGDDRFVVSAAGTRLSPYRNFERALRMVPADIPLVALCDQDDRWYSHKLEVLRATLGPAILVYSDQRLITEDGSVLRDSLWQGRRNDHRNLASLLVANTIPGAAMLFRRDLLSLALPFPDSPGVQYHDHWLALAAVCAGEVVYVDRPLYDYVQHPGAVQGELSSGRSASGAGGYRPRRRGGSRGWRAAYFCGYESREVQAQTLLLRCGSQLSPRRRRALRWFVASERSPVAFAWLALRPLRALAGHDETLGEELALVKGIVWRRLIELAVRSSERPGRRPYDASFPDPPVFEQARLRRWRAAGQAVNSLPTKA